MTTELYGEDRFEYLAEHDPQALLDLIAGGTLPPTLVTFALEYAGRVGPAALPVIQPFLQHPKSYVREGAIYGVAQLLDHDPQLRELLRQMATSDVSPGVRQSAADALEL